mgnify:CR=1 FL=1
MMRFASARRAKSSDFSFPKSAPEWGALFCALVGRVTIDIETESQSNSRSLMSSSSQNTLLPLCQLPAGALGLVTELQGEGTFRQRVRELGFGESAEVKKVSGRSTIICQVNGCRVALSHDAARCILVSPQQPQSVTG